MSKTLVAYFSFGGRTENVAEELAVVTEGDLFEIVPAEPYSDADVNWRDESSRCCVEHADPNCRPKIADTVDDFAQYDTVFIGFPIWWYTAPRIIETFLESYDFTGKTVALFATSGGTGLTKPEDELPALAPGATFKPGRLFNDGVSAAPLRAWANSAQA